MSRACCSVVGGVSQAVGSSDGLMVLGYFLVDFFRLALSMIKSGELESPDWLSLRNHDVTRKYSRHAKESDRGVPGSDAPGAGDSVEQGRRGLFP